MLTWNVQLGYILTRGGGQAVQGGLSCPRPRISERKDNQQLLKRYKLYFSQSKMLTSNVQLGRSVGLCIDKGCPGRFVLPPAQNFREKG